MPILDISEYMDAHHGVPIEPPLKHQSLRLDPAPIQSKPFHRDTRIVRLVADVDCRVAFGTDPGEPTSFIPAGRELTRIIPADSQLRLSAALAGDGLMAADMLGAAASSLRF